MLYIVILMNILIVLEYIAEKIYMSTESYIKSLNGAGSLRHVPNGIEICNIGSGPALYGISYEQCLKKGFNFSTAPQNFQYGFKLLKHFRNKIINGATVIIVLMCPMSFGDNNDCNRKGYSDKFYGILSAKEIKDYSWKRAFILNHPLLMRLIQKALSVIKPKSTAHSYKEQTDKPGIIKVWEDEFGLNNLIDTSIIKNHERTFEEKIKIIQDELEFCGQQKWNPVIVIPPVPKSTRKYVGEDFLKRFFYSNLEKIHLDYPLIPILDYYADDRFDEKAFMNDIFLNEKGKHKFSAILFKDIDSGGTK